MQIEWRRGKNWPRSPEQADLTSQEEGEGARSTELKISFRSHRVGWSGCDQELRRKGNLAKLKRKEGDSLGPLKVDGWRRKRGKGSRRKGARGEGPSGDLQVQKYYVYSFGGRMNDPSGPEPSIEKRQVGGREFRRHITSGSSATPFSKLGRRHKPERLGDFWIGLLYTGEEGVHSARRRQSPARGS